MHSCYCITALRLVEFLGSDTGTQGCQQAKGRGIYLCQTVRWCDTGAHKSLGAAIDDLVLIAEGKDKLFHLAGLAIQNQNVITRRAIMPDQAARAIQEIADKHLPTVIPACDGKLMRHCERMIKCNERALCGLRIVEH